MNKRDAAAREFAQEIANYFKECSDEIITLSHQELQKYFEDDAQSTSALLDVPSDDIMEHFGKGTGFGHRMALLYENWLVYGDNFLKCKHCRIQSN